MPNDMDPADIRIVVIGVGAIGSALLPRLLRMPFRVVTLVDGDRVEARNLERQELYAPVDVGSPKVQVAGSWARNAPVGPRVEVHDTFLDDRNAESIIAVHDIVADCTDDAHARRLIDRVCGDLGITLVSGAVHAGQGQVVVLHDEGPGEDISLEYLFPGRISMDQDGCDMRHVPLRTIDESAKRMALRIRQVLDHGPVVNGRIDLFDEASNAWASFEPPNA